MTFKGFLIRVGLLVLLLAWVFSVAYGKSDAGGTPTPFFDLVRGW